MRGKTWNKTIASTCRYGDVAECIFKDAEIIWENSEENYQGSANVFAKMPDGTFVHYEWSYGSCSGCDDWEARGLTYDQIEAEMRASMAVLLDEATAKRYFHLESAEAAVAFGGVNGDFVACGEAFQKWCVSDPT